MQFVTCTAEAHAEAILAILDEEIVSSTALDEYQPRTLDSMADWFATKEAHRYPVIGALGEDGALLGFASYGTFRDRPAYKYSVEHSVYVHKDHRRHGLGRGLTERLHQRRPRAAVPRHDGGIDLANSGSIALHEKLGFVHAGTIRQAGFKFGRWLDLVFYQLLLSTPTDPIDG